MSQAIPSRQEIGVFLTNILWLKISAGDTAFRLYLAQTSMVSYQKGPTRHAYAWQIGPFWQDTLDVWLLSVATGSKIMLS